MKSHTANPIWLATPCFTSCLLNVPTAAAAAWHNEIYQILILNAVQWSKMHSEIYQEAPMLTVGRGLGTRAIAKSSRSKYRHRFLIKSKSLNPNQTQLWSQSCVGGKCSDWPVLPCWAEHSEEPDKAVTACRTAWGSWAPDSSQVSTEGTKTGRSYYCHQKQLGLKSTSIPQSSAAKGEVSCISKVRHSYLCPSWWCHHEHRL